MIPSRLPTEGPARDAWIASRLERRGFLPSDAALDAGHMDAAVRRLQRAYGLAADGWAGPQTLRVLTDPRADFCGVPERLAIAEKKPKRCKWPQKRITWAFDGGRATILKHLSSRDQMLAFRTAWGFWAAVCGIEPEYVKNAKTANVLIAAGGIDEGGGTLAWSEMPCAVNLASQLLQRYDRDETWVLSETPQPHEIDLVRVAAHEIGHVLGIPHLASGNLLAAYYDERIRRPQMQDIVEAVARYGYPKEPSDAAVAALPAIITLNGQRYAAAAA